jgi:non-ribosomal peptide synthetase component F
LYTGWSDRLQIQAHAVDGPTETVVDIPTPPVPVTEKDRDSVLTEVSSDLQSIMAPAIPETKPTFTDLVVSDDGRLWIRRPPEDAGAETTDWWILVPETKTIQAARLPRTVDLEVVREGAAYGTTTTEVGAPAVVRYQIQPDG